MIKKLIALKLTALISAIAVGKKKGQGATFSKGRLVGYLLIYLYVALVFGGLATGVAYTLGSLLIPFGFDSLYFGLFMTVTVTLVFVLSIFETKSELFECKDNELLLSMPLKPCDIVLSRISTVLIYNYLETLIVMGPAVVVYALLGGSAIGIFGSVAVTLLMPLLATALSSGVGYLVARITKKLKNKSFFTTAIYLVFMALYFVGYNGLMQGMEELETLSPEIAMALAENLGFFGIVGSAALFSPIPFAVLVILTVLLCLIAYTIISKNYISIVTGSSASARVVYREKRLENRGCFYALALKEIRGFLSTPMYMLNSGFGIAFIVVIGIMAIVNRGELVSSLPLIAALFGEGVDPYALFYAMIPVALVFILSTVLISAPALSLEGKRLWIIKSMPVSARAVLLAKLVPHTVFTLPAVLIASVMFIVALTPSLEYIPFIILTPIAGVAFSALFGGVMGAALCRFDYQNDIQAVKQSAATGLTMLGTVIVAFGSAALTIFVSVTVSPLLASVLLLCLLTVLSVICVMILLGPLARKYDNIET